MAGLFYGDIPPYNTRCSESNLSPDPYAAYIAFQSATANFSKKLYSTDVTVLCLLPNDEVSEDFQAPVSEICTTQASTVESSFSPAYWDRILPKYQRKQAKYDK